MVRLQTPICDSLLELERLKIMNTIINQLGGSAADSHTISFLLIRQIVRYPKRTVAETAETKSRAALQRIQVHVQTKQTSVDSRCHGRHVKAAAASESRKREAN
ncbi:hypothetical protein J6590_011041 [Homalodisca vitripennis]|nr:hypothetical protein J6590_011041 [Homalodisca vitripennis]